MVEMGLYDLDNTTLLLALAVLSVVQIAGTLTVLMFLLAWDWYFVAVGWVTVAAIVGIVVACFFVPLPVAILLMCVAVLLLYAYVRNVIPIGEINRNSMR